MTITDPRVSSPWSMLDLGVRRAVALPKLIRLIAKTLVAEHARRLRRGRFPDWRETGASSTAPGRKLLLAGNANGVLHSRVCPLRTTHTDLQA